MQARPRILNAEPEGYSPEARKILQSLGDLEEEPLVQQQLAERASDFDVLIVRLGLRVTRDVLEKGNRLCVVVSATTGLDHIDLEEATHRGVEVISLQGESEFLSSIPASAEYTWALLLALTRRLPWAFCDVQQGGWNRDSFQGHDLRGRTLGILGLGRIGEKVARYGRAFEMQVGALDPFRKGWMDGVRRFDTAKTLLSWSDVMSVHLPLDTSTHGLLDEQMLRFLPVGSWLVNTSRGGIIDEAGLVNLLADGHLAGAAVDVLSNEQPLQSRDKSPLLRYARNHHNLIITPHLAGATYESMAATEVFVAQKLGRFLAQR